MSMRMRMRMLANGTAYNVYTYSIYVDMSYVKEELERIG